MKRTLHQLLKHLASEATYLHHRYIGKISRKDAQALREIQLAHSLEEEPVEERISR